MTTREKDCAPWVGGGGVELLDLTLPEADDPTSMASGEGDRRELLYESSS